MKEFFADLFNFSTTLHIVRFICIVLIIALVIFEAVRLILAYVKSKKEKPVEQAEPTNEQAEEDIDETSASVAEQVVEEEPVEEAPVEEAPVVTEVKEEPTTKKEEIVISDLSDDLETAKRVPFKDKILASEEKIQTYYTEVENAFRAYRNINVRLSIKGLSFRFGRELVAKMTIRGRTLKLHLALDVNEFEQSVYFQKDMSDVKEYVSVPFAVKIRSDRALKNALVLIGKLAEKHGIEKKARYTKVDSIANLKSEN